VQPWPNVSSSVRIESQAQSISHVYWELRKIKRHRVILLVSMMPPFETLPAGRERYVAFNSIDPTNREGCRAVEYRITMGVRILLSYGLGVVLLVSSNGQQLASGISGHVLYPDGSPSEGAKVIARTECVGMPFVLVQEVRTAPDGSFHFAGFQGADCNQVRLHAEKAEDLWLRTGKNAFYNGDNGTTPLVASTSAGPPAVSDIVLGIQGGSVDIRVWDKATDQFIKAGLHVERKPQRGAAYGSMDTATGDDGSGHKLLLPPGEYLIYVNRFPCRGAEFFAANGPYESFVVKSGQRMAKDISVDVRRIKPVPSFANPHGRACTM
jgi:hypothetical protein